MKYSKAFNEIFDNLSNGKRYGYMVNPYSPCVNEPYFSTTLCVDLSRTTYKPLLFWTHYGSSANAFTKSELKWLLDKIYKVSAEEFVSTYICK